ncbi:MAG: S49 family peptidase [Rhodospirillaceae bacterium]|nr:S49 family peptidase [Rhodospirillaceae bacterium]
MINKLLKILPIKRFRNPDPIVSVLRLHGVIGRAGPIGSSGLSQQSLDKDIEKAFSINRACAVALSINSPGGSPVQSSLIAKRIRNLSGEKNIPVFGFVEDVAASGGYWLACAADEIFADENSIVGSIGVISAGFGFVDALEKLGVERRVHASGNNKAMLDPFRPEDPKEIKKLLAIQKEIHQNFKNLVSKRRGEKIRVTKKNLFEGDIWTGRQAEELGLVDGIGDLQTVMRKRFGDKTKFKNINHRQGPIRRILGGGESHMRERVLLGLDIIEEWSVWKRFGL